MVVAAPKTMQKEAQLSLSAHQAYLQEEKDWYLVFSMPSQPWR